MHKLTRFATAALIATAGLGGATAATAHPGDGYGSGYGRSDGRPGYGYGRDDRQSVYQTNEIRRQLDELSNRVNRSDGRDRISEREAANLRREIREARQQFRWLNRDGLNHQELRQLQARIAHIRYNLRDDRRDRDGHPG